MTGPLPVCRPRSGAGGLFRLFALMALATLGLAAFCRGETVSALRFTTTQVAQGRVGAPYAQAIGVKGGTPPYAFGLSQNTKLPAGLALAPATGSLSGKPSAAGNFSFFVKVTDAAGATAQFGYTLQVLSATAPTSLETLHITTSQLPAGKMGAAYSTLLSAQGGTSPYLWYLASGTQLPKGLSLGAKTGAIQGTPTQAGTTTFKVVVWDTQNHAALATFALSLADGAAAGGGDGGTGSTGGGTPPPPPPATYAVTVVNGTGSGSYAAGATVAITAAAAPSGQAFRAWTGNAAVANSLAPSTTFTMPAASVTETATYAAVQPVPFPVATHPRLWLTPSDLPRLRSWAAASNPIYQQGLVPLLAKAVADYDTRFFPNGAANPNYPDPGDTQGYSGLISEQYALVFAFQSLIDPDPNARIRYAQYARNLVMHAMNEAAKGVLAGAPFRDPMFPTYNRANATSEAWPLAVDWIYDAVDGQGQPILTAQDRLTVRNVFMTWAAECLNASTTGGDHPSPVGASNSASLLPGGNAYRYASNNYYLGHARLLTMMSLAIDPADDPPVDPAQPAAALGNSLRSYIPNATGAWLYQEYAMLGDAASVRADYGLPAGAKVGLASGGLPPEGMLYGHSYSFVLGQLLALKTAGFADPLLSGPQAALANNAPVWDRFVRGFISSLAPAAKVYPGYQYMGPVYQMASYGDILRLWITPDFAQPFALLALLDARNGDGSRLNAERWFVVNALEGGPGGLLGRVSNPWSYGVQDALLAFTLLDPAAPAATDPRAGYPTAFYDAPQGRLVEHSDWSAGGAMFDFRCSWISINHQQADGNQFEFYRNGEWLTKGVANYDNTSQGLTTDYHNTLSLKNWCPAGTPADLGWWEAPFWVNGSQWQLGSSAGDPAVSASVGGTYTYACGDATNLYNRPSPWTPSNAATDIVHASRSILWLKPDHIVVYDRATSKTAGLFKRFNLALTAAPSVSGNLVTTTTPGGQHLYLTSLLPAGATFTSAAIGAALQPMAQLEPSTHRLVIEDPTLGTDVRFLNVLQGADASAAADPVMLVQSSAGTAFDGAVVLDAAVMFKRDLSVAFSSTTFTVPSTTTRFYVTGLTPGAGYAVSRMATAQGIVVTVAPGGTAAADSAGVLAF